MATPEPAPVEVFIGLGSNLGDAKAHLRAGLEGLAGLEGYEPLAVSSLYLTAPVGPQDQPPFCNAVARGRFRGSARELLGHLLAIEQTRGRRRELHWGPRTLDLDLLLFGREIIQEPDLVVPHPEMHRRAFVLVPLMELAPELKLPRWQKTAAELYQALTPRERAEQAIEPTPW